MTDPGILAISSLVVFCINLPFGYWRENTRKLSLQWYLAVHLPVPFVILTRYVLHTGWHWSSYVFFVAAFFLGQFGGGIIKRKMAMKYPGKTTSCLFVDIYRLRST